MKHVAIALLLIIVLGKVPLQARMSLSGVTVADLKQVSGALETFNVEHGRYPTQTEGLRALVDRPKENWSGYLKTVPKDPWDNEYIYRYPGRHNTNSFDLYSLGQNGRSRTAGNDSDDVNNWDPTEKWRKYYGRPWRNLSAWQSLIICGIGIAVVSALILVWRCAETVRQCN